MIDPESGSQPSRPVTRDAGDPVDAVDRALIDAFAAEDPQWQEWPGDPGAILDLGDLETHWVLARRAEGFTFETISRGHRTTTGTFPSARDARCFLLMRLGGAARSRRRLPDLGSVREVAPGTSLHQQSGRYRLAWRGGAAEFADQYDATEFSWVAGVEPAEIAASYRAADGRPLFLVEVGGPEVVRPRGPVQRPAPAVPPPPDPEAPEELPVLDQIAGQIDWARQAVAEADVLAVGDGDAGRVVGYDGAAFVYSSFVRDWRRTVATFSSAAAARRFLVAEIGAIRRTRSGQPIRRVHRTHPDTDLVKGPTQFDLTWSGGAAIFGLGYTGHQQAKAP